MEILIFMMVGKNLLNKSEVKRMEKVKKISKYVLNILTIISALLLGINAVEGITIPYCAQITGVIAAINGVISTYLLGQKAIKKEE